MFTLKSKIAPYAFANYRDYYILNDLYYKTLVVTAFPEYFSLGLLSYYASNPNLQVRITTKPTKLDVTEAVNKEFKQKLEKLKKSRNVVEKDRLRNEAEQLENYVKELNAIQDKTLNFLMTFTIHADTLEDLKSNTKDLKKSLREDGFRTEVLMFQMENLLKYTSPFFMESSNNMTPTLKENLGIPITTTSVSGMWPYTFQTLKDEKGFIFGKEKQNSGIILWDPLLYINDKVRAKNENRITGNIAILGTSGSGKTTDENLIIRYLIKEKMNLIWIDPENKNMYLTKKYGGTFIQWGQKGNQVNLFDLKPVSTDEDSDADPWDTELAIYNAIDEFKNLMMLYKPGISEDTLDIISELVIEMYAEAGITFDTSFQYMTYDQFPILSDLNRIAERKYEEIKNDPTTIKQKNALNDLLMKLKPMLTEHKYYFDGHTTIFNKDASRNIISFGTRILFSKSLELRNALNYIMFSFVKGYCLNPDIRSATIFSEAHMFILEGKAAEEMAIIWRRSRKYYNCAIMDDQEPQDLSSSAIAVHGLSIINNSSYRIIKMLEKNAIDKLNELIRLNDSELKMIESFKRGDALFLCGNRHISINVLATENELLEMDPTNAR